MSTLRIIAVALCLVLSATAANATTATQVMQRATDAVDEFLGHLGEDDVTRVYVQNAYAVLVAPGVVTGGFVVGAQHGFGMLFVRDPESGRFGPPAFYEIFGGSVGFQAGGKSSDLLITVMNRRAVDALLDGGMKLGAEFSLAALRAGGTFGAATSTAFGEDMYLFERTAGFYGGVSLSGARIQPQHVHNDDYWGERTTAGDVVRDYDRRDPPSAKLREMLLSF